jgi:SOS-response transcriptional repressor LexA
VVPTAWIVQIVSLVQQYIHAGGGQSDDPEFLPVAVPTNGRYLCMRVAGDCMLPDVEPGDIVVLDQEMAVMPDWIAAIRLDGETRLTRMIRRDPDEWQFAPDNPAFQGLIVPANGVEIIGVVIARQKGPGVRRSPRLHA